ncbi:MAG: hypothetical protein E7773_15035 [Sphingomonas sp.]|uniref:hypothetical protein n=1 Tax=Sphingomonas sp. TaxID=28214 RepID=UPI0011F86A54|nr:hypothetical protein [Sphingomonas sp.]THD34498.1 MAG: hypothetical protein E7773_15035 [Sphingomonas sp.]
MKRAAVALAFLLLTVRPELVEGRVAGDMPSPPASIGSARTVEGQSALDAEHAFAADAKTLGQWTAFRKWSTDDAVMFTPQPVNAHEWLKGRNDPPKAIDWWPTASYISCDGSLAVNTGGWKRADGSVGYFTTLWQRQNNGDWKWTVDGGDALKVSRPRQRPAVIKAICSNPPGMGMREGYPDGGGGVDSSEDGTLRFEFRVSPDGGRSVAALLWDGRKFRRVIEDKTAGSPPNK